MRFFCCLLLLFAFSACEDPETKLWRAEIERYRLDTDAAFRDAEVTPLKPDDRAAFNGLPYFPTDPAFQVQAWLTPASGGAPLRLPTTNNTVAWYQRYGTATFTLGGQQHTLAVFRPLGTDGRSPESQLFIPFRDATSNRTTYGGGRYLDLPLPPPGETPITLDFNRAYNPYCVYNSAYSCAIPPQENYVPVAIEAGMKMWPLAE